MSDFTDDDGQPIFTEDFTPRTVTYDGVSIDVVETNGNLWLSGPEALEAMGFQQHKSGGHGRRLKRITSPDRIRVFDTPFRFTDGRRNRGSLISPRAVLQLAEGKTQNFNPIKANAFVEWVKDHLLTAGLDAEAWSPARKAPVRLEPVFHKVITVAEENEAGEPLDPLRPHGDYPGLRALGPLRKDEVVFECDGFGGRIAAPVVDLEAAEHLEVIDDGDDFPAHLIPHFRAA